MVRTTSDTNFTDFSRIFQGQITVFKEKDLFKNLASLTLSWTLEWLKHIKEPFTIFTSSAMVDQIILHFCPYTKIFLDKVVNFKDSSRRKKRNKVLFKDPNQIQGLFKTTTKIQDLFNIVRTMPVILYTNTASLIDLGRRQRGITAFPCLFL